MISASTIPLCPPPPPNFFFFKLIIIIYIIYINNRALFMHENDSVEELNYHMAHWRRLRELRDSHQLSSTHTRDTGTSADFGAA